MNWRRLTFKPVHFRGPVTSCWLHLLGRFDAEDVEALFQDTGGQIAQGQARWRVAPSAFSTGQFS